MRAALRITTSAGVTGPHALVLYAGQDGWGQPQVPDSTVAEALLRDGAARLKCGATGVAAQECPASVPVTEGVWHQVDVVIENLGTAQGSCALRLDGAEVCRFARDWRNVSLASIGLGASAMEPTWVGELLAVTRGGPAPAQVTLVAPAAPITGVCLPLRLELHDNLDGGLARGAAAEALALGRSGTALRRRLRGCAAQQPHPRCGLAAIVLGLRAPVGQVTVSARDLGGDLAPGFTALRVGP